MVHKINKKQLYKHLYDLENPIYLDVTKFNLQPVAKILANIHSEGGDQYK